MSSAKQPKIAALSIENQWRVDMLLAFANRAEEQANTALDRAQRFRADARDIQGQAAPPPPANIGADSPRDVEALVLRLIPAIVEGLWDARDSGEEVAEIKPFIDRDAAVIVKHVRAALLATPAEGGGDADPS